jgi:hypothetical protein
MKFNRIYEAYLCFLWRFNAFSKVFFSIDSIFMIISLSNSHRFQINIGKLSMYELLKYKIQEISTQKQSIVRFERVTLVQIYRAKKSL